MLSALDFDRARRRLGEVLQPTPLQYSATFSRYTGHDVWIKPENLQKTGAFKARGAYNKLTKLTDEQRSAGVITASSGNHGAAVAWAASELGTSATVVMPVDAPQSKLRAVAGYGAEIIQHGMYADERKARAKQLAETGGKTYVDSTDDEDIIEGQGTCAVEIIEELPDVDAIVGPVGGGGLMSGVTAAAKLHRESIETVAVEPSGCCSMYCSIEAGHPVEVKVDTIADGLRTRIPGETPFSYISRYTDAFHLVAEDLIKDAMLLILERMKMLCEPSGAVAPAGVLDGAVGGTGKKVVAIVTGGNVDLDLVRELVDSGLSRDWGDNLRP